MGSTYHLIIIMQSERLPHLRCGSLFLTSAFQLCQAFFNPGNRNVKVHKISVWPGQFGTKDFKFLNKRKKVIHRGKSRKMPYFGLIHRLIHIINRPILNKMLIGQAGKTNICFG